MRYGDIRDEDRYDEARAVERLERAVRDGRYDRRAFLRLTAAGATSAALIAAGRLPVHAQASPSPAGSPTPTPAPTPMPPAKPVPEDAFFNYGTNFETRWERLAGSGYTTPNDLFFIRTHTRRPAVDLGTWRLTIDGDGVDGPIELSYDDLRALDTVTVTRSIECAGNGRSLFETVGGTKAKGTQWKLGAIGVADWTGVPLGALLERAGLRADAVDVMPWGGDETQVRRPIPVQKALLEDTIVALDMNGVPLPEDHGFPARLIVPNWVGVANIKWLARIEVAREALWSDWNTGSYVLTGPGYLPQPPALGPVLTTQTIKSALELPWEDASLPAGSVVLSGRSWSGEGPIARVDVSVDEGEYVPATLVDDPVAGAWTRWELPWEATAGAHAIRARATDQRGNVQPDAVPFNEQGYLYSGIVPHAVTVG